MRTSILDLDSMDRLEELDRMLEAAPQEVGGTGVASRSHTRTRCTILRRYAVAARTPPIP